ncbi:glycosyltransferase involved in cell wall biosynthesis [Loktanella sp. PT4BL]|jgi:hypothetical protein|uniref:glycosyltransferase family A protein n=1 Tax=Loktanella sp. PT4BL TaxID=2135611 RepID=UPI000D76E679|nr:glycosyltransferase family A protein [Loktanella sp. PT4BL]PXW66160.1 glycosyltransferase involved in cell wall biosynthesis [Loktanella sp. PT4BL]
MEEDVKAIPIVVSGYNRRQSLARVLQSLNQAIYRRADIPLYVSLDDGGADGTLEVARAFQWRHGPKSILPHSRPLGMREHAFKCMELPSEFEQLIFIEDDSYAGPEFYEFAVQVAHCVNVDEEVFAASLYSFDICEFDRLRFAPLQTGEDAYLSKSASTWGILVDKRKWQGFRDWYETNGQVETGALYVPDQVNFWPKTSWKKHLNRYLSAKGLSFIYPVNSHLTHFADRGTHYASSSANFQVPFVHRRAEGSSRSARLNTNNMARYDEFWELIPDQGLIDAIGLEFEFDIRRLKRTTQLRSPYVITSRHIEKPLKSFGRDLFPLEANVLQGFQGTDLNLTSSDAIPNVTHPADAQEVRLYMKDLGTRREILLTADRLLRKLRLKN